MSDQPNSFAPGTVAPMRAALDAAVDQINESHRTPATKPRWPNKYCRGPPTASLTSTIWFPSQWKPVARRPRDIGQIDPPTLVSAGL